MDLMFCPSSILSLHHATVLTSGDGRFDFCISSLSPSRYYSFLSTLPCMLQCVKSGTAERKQEQEKERAKKGTKTFPLCDDTVVKGETELLMQARCKHNSQQ